jgi:cobaltochelatase CobN
VKEDPRWSDKRLADHYAARLSHAYDGGETDGAADGEAFSDNLKTVDAAVFSRSSNAYGLLDTPMPAAYLGGLNMAVRTETGRRIETYVANLQSPDAASLETADRTLNRELRSRYFNPAWIKGMQAGGYNGARYLSEFTANMLLWDVTSPGLIQDRDWNEVADVYVRDRYKLGLKAYFAHANPQARTNLLKTMVEAAERGHWRADAATLADLRRQLGQPGRPPAPGPARSATRAVAPASGGKAAARLAGYEMRTIAPSPPPAPVNPVRPAWLALILLAALLVLAGALREPRVVANGRQGAI